MKEICEYRVASTRYRGAIDEPFERLSRVGDYQTVETLKDEKVYGDLHTQNGQTVRVILPYAQPKYYHVLKLIRYGKVMATYRLPEPKLPMHIAHFQNKWEGRIGWTFDDQRNRPKGPYEI